MQLDTIVCGDCLDVMAEMPDGCVDLVITSPPYNLGISSGGGIKGGKKSGKWQGAALADGYGKYDDAMPDKEYVVWQKSVLGECWRIINDEGAIYYNHKPRIQNGQLQLPMRLNPSLPLRQIVIWLRKGGINFATTHYLPCHEWILIFAKAAFRLKSKGASGVKDVWEIPQVIGNGHPATFPEELPIRILETTNAQVIFDPFMGSGTTAVAALKLGRHFYGCDINQDYVDLANERIAKAKLEMAQMEMSL